MAYLVPVVLVLLGFIVDVTIEASAGLSSNTFIDNDAGAPVKPVEVQSGTIIDLRPESSI